jgi:acyl-coenzyme A synthetase/AMP-(fatty) acid ligase
MLVCARIGAVHSGCVWCGSHRTRFAIALTIQTVVAVITADQGVRGGKHNLAEAECGQGSLQDRLACNTLSLPSTCVPEAISTGTNIAIFFNTRRLAWLRSVPTAQPSRWIGEDRSSSLHLVLPASQQAYCIPQAVIYWAQQSINMRSIITKVTYWCTADVGWITGTLLYCLMGPLV